MKKILFILLCLPLVYSCNSDKRVHNFEYINLPRLENEKNLHWRGLLKEGETFKIYLNKGEVINLPAAYLASVKYYGEINPGQTLNLNDENDFNCYSFCFKSLKSDYYYFSIYNRLSNGADDKIIDRITDYTFIID